MKDVISCDKLRLGANIRMTRRCPNGETHVRRPYVSIRQSITYGGEPGELKHLSSRRKRKKISISRVAASEKERAQTSVRARWGYGLHKLLLRIRRTVLGKPAREGESPVPENPRQAAGSRVPRDTRNLVGSRGDHPPRLNTT